MGSLLDKLIYQGFHRSYGNAVKIYLYHEFWCRKQSRGGLLGIPNNKAMLLKRSISSRYFSNDHQTKWSIHEERHISCRRDSGSIEPSPKGLWVLSCNFCILRKSQTLLVILKLSQNLQGERSDQC